MKNNNIDPQEIAKFDKIAKDWWNPDGQMKPLHLLNPVRLNYVLTHSNIEQLNVLDVGCGGGILTESLVKAGASRVSAIDLSTQALGVAKSHAKEANLNINYQEIRVEDLAEQQPESFDVITCMEMLEHVPDPSSIIQACATLTKPGGFVFFSTISRNPKAYLMAILGAEYLLNLLPKGTHDYKSFIRPSELDEWAKLAGLQLIDLSGMHYSPTKGTFSINRDVSVNYLTCYQKPC